MLHGATYHRGEHQQELDHVRHRLTRVLAVAIALAAVLLLARYGRTQVCWAGRQGAPNSGVIKFCILFLKIYDFDRAVSGLRQKVSHGLLGILGNSWEGPGIVGKDFNYGRQAALVLARVARPLSLGCHAPRII